MPSVKNPGRTPLVRLITIASAGMGSFILGLWGIKIGLGDSLAEEEMGVVNREIRDVRGDFAIQAVERDGCVVARVVEVALKGFGHFLNLSSEDFLSGLAGGGVVRFFDADDYHVAPIRGTGNHVE